MRQNISQTISLDASTNNKSNIKCRNTHSCLDQYLAPNNRYTGGEWPPSPTNRSDSLLQMQVGVNKKWSLYLLWWTNWTLISDTDTRVNFHHSALKMYFEIINEIDCQTQSSPKLLGILTVHRRFLGLNMKMLTWLRGELSYSSKWGKFGILI